MTARSRPLAALIARALALALALPAAAQHGVIPTPQARPLHARLAEADAAALGTVEAIETGRIRVAEATAVFGDVPARFELKRSPAAPPALAAGDRALLLLRGARAPYLLVDGPDGALRGESAPAFAEALARAHAVLDRPERLRALYAEWLEGDDAALRAEAALALADADAAFQPLPAGVAEALARRALDPDEGRNTRRQAAIAAVASRAGARALLAGLPGAEGADAAVVAIALRAAVVERDSALDAALGRVLAHERPEIRLIGVRLGAMRHDAALLETIRRLADSDPDTMVRRTAARALKRRN